MTRPWNLTSALLSDGYRTFFEAMVAERLRQCEKFGPQDLTPSLPDDDDRADIRILITSELQAKRLCDDAFANERGSWAHIAIEEMAEIVDAPDDAHRREELIQLATVCMAWVEAIDRQTLPPTSSGPGEIT